MRRKDWHGNRLRSAEEAWEMKKKRSRERYARRELALNPFWHHNKVLRELVHLFGVGTPISMAHFETRSFNINIFKAEENLNNRPCRYYDEYKIYPYDDKNIVICKI